MRENTIIVFFVDDLSIEKIMELDGTTKYRTQNDPYFMFPQTAYINNAIVTGGTSGKNRTANGRGTFVTEATTNSLGMRAEMLYSDAGTSKNNPLGIYIPLKNVNFDTTYKVTFDFSVAKQGIDAADPAVLNGYVNRNSPGANWHEYSDFDEIFDVGTNPIQSYLHSGLDVRRTQEGHNDLKAQITYANKLYQNYQVDGKPVPYGYPLTKYDEVYSQNSDLNYTTSTSVNDTFSSAYDPSGNNTINRNYFNAVRHTEYNGQNKINWLTFYNTTFSFNIPQAENQELNIDDLYWIWEIDATRYTAYYNIRIDNVRIEKVVDYASGLDSNGFKIGSTTISPITHLDNAGQGRTEDDGHTGIDTGGRDINAFANYKGRNSTGQNFQARMHDTDMLMIRGNIYAPIVDASRFQAKAATDPYKIFLDGWAVVEGGISKYVFSVDGGNTWQDMIFEGNSNTDYSGDSYGILREAEYGINQYVKGQTTQYNGTNWIKFDSVDAANGRFDNFTLYADLQAYATQANLDVIIAAVPMSDITCRCEILRIINFNQIRNYMTFPYDFVSDITIYDSTPVVDETSQQKKSATTRLNAHRIKSQDAHYNWDDAVAEITGFTSMKTWQLANYTTGGTTTYAGPNETTGYARMGARSHAYEDIRTAFSGIPVQKELSVTGWAMVEGGVEDYYWSADHGKTWTLCTGNPKSDRTEPVSKQYKQLYYDGTTYNAANDSEFLQKHCFRDSIDGNFTGASVDKKSGDMLTANLSNYVGQCVDVIFAAKPVGSDVYVPVGRCDNVAVYGEKGTFYTRVHRLMIDGRSIDNLNGDPSATPISPVTDDFEGKDINLKDRWGLGYSADMAYVIFETQNVNPINSRYFNKTPTPIKSGGKVSIDGYVMCKGGVERYKFSLDGGKSWTIINDNAADITADAENSKMVSYSKASDNSFHINVVGGEKDGGNGNFCCTSYSDGTKENSYGSSTAATRKKFYDHCIEFNIPALPDGAVKDLLVVAEGKYNKNIPVLHMKIKAEFSADNTSQYGYVYSKNKTDISTLNVGYGAEINQDWTFVPPPAKTGTVIDGNNIINRVTIPVTEVGEHQLTFNHSIANPPISESKTKHQLRDNNAKVQNKYTDITLSVDKTHFVVGEAIGVDFTCKFNSATAVTELNGYGTLTLSIISNDWKNQNGEQHAIRAKSYAPNLQNLDEKSYHENDIRAFTTKNDGLVNYTQDFKAGSYSILLVHRTPVQLSNILINKTYREAYVLAEIPIYIHDPDETVEFSVVHDSGEYTYFSNVSEQYDSVGAGKKANADHIYTLTDPFSNEDSRAITANVNVTEADVKRGYIVLDANYSGLWAGNEHTEEQCEADYGSNNFGNNNEHASEHADDLCVSRESTNGSTFTKIFFGGKEPLRKVMSGGEVAQTMYHQGIEYNTKLSLGPNALTRKLDQDTIDVIFAKAEQGYGNNVLMNTVTASGEHTVSYGSILNPPITKGAMKFIPANSTSFSDPYNGSYLSVPKTYFNVGEPITVDYKTVGVTASNVYVYITSAQECNSKKYGDLYIKQAQVTKNTAGTLNFTASSYNLGNDVYTNPNNHNVELWRNNFDELNKLRSLCAGEYKIWLINNGGSFDPFNMQKHGWNLVTEPISIKVVDPKAPDLSMTYWSDRTYPNQTDNTTALTLNKVVYEQGEDIPFRISGEYEHVWVTVLKSDDFKGYIVDNLNNGFESYLNKNGTYARYAEWGSSRHADDLSGGVLKTTDGGVPLEPGQYKVVYLFGQCLQHAWQGKAFPDKHNGQAQKIMAIIDITIVPKNTLQKYSASYVKNDGSIGNIPLDIESPSVKDLVTTTTNLNDSTFTVNTTPTTKNITINVPNDVDTSVVNNVALTIKTLPGTYSRSTYSSGKDNYSSTFFSADRGSGTAAIKLPVTQTGEYNLNFSGYLNSPIAHHGFNRGTTIWENQTITLNYTGAYLAVPKTVYVKGEDIPISYYTRGSVAAVSPVKESGNLPWIGILPHNTTEDTEKNNNYFENSDKDVNDPNGVPNLRNYVAANKEGIEYISTKDLVAGTYQIYLRDNSAKLFHPNYWWEYDMVDPITIVIKDSAELATDPQKTNPQLEYVFSNVPHIKTDNSTGHSSGKVTLNKNVFYQGESISCKVELTEGTSGITYTLALYPVGEGNNDWITWMSANTNNKTYELKTSGLSSKGAEQTSTSGSYKLPPGRYTLYLFNAGNSYGAHINGRVYATMDITILPEKTPTTALVKGTAQIQSLVEDTNEEIVEVTQTAQPSTTITDPFNYYNVSGKFNVTAEDVARGYVLLEYSFMNLPTYSDFTFTMDNLTYTKN